MARRGQEEASVSAGLADAIYMAKKSSRDLDMGSPMGKKWRDSLRKAADSVEGMIQPLLHGWLQYSQDGM